MDWARVAATIEQFETLDPDQLKSELKRLETKDVQLFETVDSLLGHSAAAGSFMQTRMPGSENWAKPSLQPKSKIDAWEVEELLGSGGMGEVYRAKRADGLFEQTVALKLARLKGAEFVSRFEAERQRLAQLEHPGIARIIDGGASENGAPYMTLEFVDGQPIDAYAKEQRLGRTRRLSLIRSLCSALSHAHGRLVLHRDIKHDNVLINADGDVRLIDFGVASLLNDTSAQESRGPLTVAFAAPEQLEGKAVSAATDIFAVGMLAHLLETGSLPKRQSDGGVAIDLNKIGNADLSAILEKATAKEPQDRYASADALGDDLEKFLGGFPVAARPVSSVTRFKKLVARNRLTAAVSAAAAVALVGGVIGVSLFAVRASEEAEANRIAQQRGANTIEYYETVNAGLIDFAASLDEGSETKDALFSALQEFELGAQFSESSSKQKATEAYVFLAKFHSDLGNEAATARLWQKLAAHAEQLNYPSALTLSRLAIVSDGIIDPDELYSKVDHAHDFFQTDPAVHAFGIAENRCLKARMTRSKPDERHCVRLALSHLETINTENYAEATSNLTLRAYAMQSARQLKDFQLAKQIGNDALSFYDEEDRPALVPKSMFDIALSDIAQAEGDWSASHSHLNDAIESLRQTAPAPYLDLAVQMELAQTLFALERYDAALEHATRATDLAKTVYGEQHYQVRDAESEIARALAKKGEIVTAKRMLREIIEAEAASDNDPAAIKRYRGMLKEMLGK